MKKLLILSFITLPITAQAFNYSFVNETSNSYTIECQFVASCPSQTKSIGPKKTVTFDASCCLESYQVHGTSSGAGNYSSPSNQRVCNNETITIEYVNGKNNSQGIVAKS